MRPKTPRAGTICGVCGGQPGFCICKRKPTAYERGQHTLICNALKVSADPNAPGLTAYEAVCVVIMKLDIAMEAIRETLKNNKHLADGENCTLIQLKQASATLRRRPESFDVLPLYGTENS